MMLKTIVVVLMLLVSVTAELVAIACCKAAGQCSREEEKYTDQKYKRG